jgi:hypothetical protein
MLFGEVASLFPQNATHGHLSPATIQEVIPWGGNSTV